MLETVDVHDLPESERTFVHEFVEFLRQKLRLRNKEREEDKEWPKLTEGSFAQDWENEKDAAYDNWKERYNVRER